MEIKRKPKPWSNGMERKPAPISSSMGGEMLAEYDLTHAVRGRRHQQQIGIDLPGVQFLTNTQGQKTAVLLDLNLHQDLWNSTTTDYPDLTNFQFLINNHSRSVFLDFTHHLPL
jgi:hypothetical protein